MDGRPGWIWLPRLLGFVGAFFAVLFVLSQLLIFLGASFPEANAQLLNGWVVLAMVAAALLASWFGQTRLSRRPFRDLGLPAGVPAFRALALGTGLGVAIIGAVVLTLVALGWLRWVPDADTGSAVLASLALFGVLLGAAFVEELLFRGYPFQLLERRFGTIVALVATSVVFSLSHGPNPNATPLSLVNVGLAGVLLGVSYIRSRSLWFATGIHAGWNFTMALSELSVSGLDFRMPGYDPSLRGPDLLTGGAFGPEGGLLVTLVTAVAIVRMWRWRLEDESLSPPRRPVGEASRSRTERNAHR